MKTIKDYIPEFLSKTKAKLRLDYTVDDFIKDYTQIRLSKMLQTDFVSDYNDLLKGLSLSGLITVSQNYYENDILALQDISEECKSLCSETTLGLLARQKLKISRIVDLNKPLHDIDLVLEGGMPFDCFVALKYLRTKASALERGIPFELSLQVFKKLMTTKRCKYSGVVLTLYGEHSVSIDRIDSTKGYLPDNVVACSKTVNGLKNDLLEDQVKTKLLSKQELKNLLSAFANIL